ncbi:MAG TPA: alpha/beta hydrolase [Thermoanaerobaculia bacterium]|nr:alpha/beta hydrolase [Thermoanaerobaculia bacterium]
MRSRVSRVLAVTGAAAAGAAALAHSAYRKDLRAALRRIETGRAILELAQNPIEYGEAQSGPPVLVVHGAGGGFDQGLDVGRALLGDGYRIVAPSRFGYLGTPMPADASPEAQAEAHVRLLDALKIERAAAIGISAGAPSAMQFSLRHPERCSALVLVVPMAWAPRPAPVTPPSRLFAIVLEAIASSDFLYWAAMKAARPILLETILATPAHEYRSATMEDRREVDRILAGVLPMSRRAAGIHNDSVISSTLPRYPLEEIHAPTLVLSAANDLYGTYDSGLYTAEQIHRGKFIGFHTGGHLLVGHSAAVRTQITNFLAECLAAEPQPAMAG